MADSTKKWLRSVTDAIAAGGGRLIDVKHGKHLKIRFANPHGLVRVLVCSISPSDWRAVRKNEQILQRLMAERASSQVRDT